MCYGTGSGPIGNRRAGSHMRVMGLPVLTGGGGEVY